VAKAAKGDPMASRLHLGYLLALGVTLSYALWYIGLGQLVSLSSGAYAPLLPLLLVQLISTAIVLAAIFARGPPGGLPRFDPRYAIVSGVFFAAGNYAFFITINSNGVPLASSFATAEILVFSLLLWATSKSRKSAGSYVVGSALIAAGLIAESFRLNGSAVVLNAALFEYGALLAALYGLATFFYYLSVERTKEKLGTMLGIEATEIALFLALLAANLGSVTLPALNAYYLAVVAVVGVSLFVSFFAETVLVDLLIPFGRRALSTGYALSSLQLVPVLVYALAMDPSGWLSFAPGMALIVAGSVFLEWK
jgi:hypothetical protein